MVSGQQLQVPQLSAEGPDGGQSRVVNVDAELSISVCSSGTDRKASPSCSVVTAVVTACSDTLRSCHCSCHCRLADVKVLQAPPVRTAWLLH